MIKRKNGIDANKAFEASCKKNNIRIVARNANMNSPTYIDLAGMEKDIDSAKKEDEFRVGDLVRVYGKTKKGKSERIQVFEGVVLRKQNNSSKGTFTVRKNVNGKKFSKTWSVNSPSIEKIEVIRKGKTRSSRLNYLKGNTNKLFVRDKPGLL